MDVNEELNFFFFLGGGGFGLGFRVDVNEALKFL